jgi:hypothetical protein
VLTGHADGLITINIWIELVTVLDEMARSLGHPDFYPFVMPREVVKKLHFISHVVRDAQGPSAGGPETVAKSA